MAAAVSLTDEVRRSVSALTALIEALTSPIAVVTSRAAPAICSAALDTVLIEASFSWAEPAMSRADWARLSVLPVTCSSDADSSTSADTTCSVDALTDAAWAAVSCSEAAIWLVPLSALSRDRNWLVAPSDTSCAVWAMIDAVLEIRPASSRKRAASAAAMP